MPSGAPSSRRSLYLLGSLGLGAPRMARPAEGDLLLAGCLSSSKPVRAPWQTRLAGQGRASKPQTPLAQSQATRSPARRDGKLAPDAGPRALRAARLAAASCPCLAIRLTAFTGRQAENPTKTSTNATCLEARGRHNKASLREQSDPKQSGRSPNPTTCRRNGTDFQPETLRTG